MTNWTSERALGFVVGAMTMFTLSAAVATRSPLPALGALIVLAVGLLVPKMQPGR